MPTNDTKALSMSERESRIRQAFYRQFTYDDFWLSDVYEGYVIASGGTADYWRVEFTEGEDSIVFAARADWQPVEKEWVAAKQAEPLVAFGSSIKALGEGKFGGYLVVFGDETKTDLTGDFFTADTDFDVDDWTAEVKCSVYWNHGLDPVIGRKKLCTGTLKKDDVGIWLEGKLDERDKYEKAIYDHLIVPQKAGMSSGTLGHLVERERKGAAAWIKKWPLGSDGSITHVPAEPRTTVMALKSAQFAPLPEDNPAPTAQPEASAKAQAAQPVQGGAVLATEARPEVKSTITITERDNMAETQQPQDNTELQAMKSKMDEFSTRLNQILQYMEDSPALKNSGYFSVDGGKADPNTKSLGDFLKAVQRHDVVRLEKHYGSMKALEEGSGAAGGYLVPEEFNRQLLQVAMEQSPILGLIPRQPVGSSSGKYPALDNYTAPTAGSGQTAAAGGVKTAKRAEGGTYAENGDPAFVEIEYKVNDAISGIVKTSRELRNDSAFSIEQLLRNLLAIADAAKQEYYVLQGNGVGEPLGILNSPALIDVTPDSNGVFAYADALEMVSRFKPVSAGRTRWARHMSMIPDFGVMTVASGSPAVLQTNMSGSIVEVLLGYAVVNSEHLAQADASGCVNLIDFGAYMIFDRGGLEIDFSEHAAFTTGQDVWRFSRRMDGKPWQKGAITLAGPGSAYTVSPFVRFND